MNASRLKEKRGESLMGILHLQEAFLILDKAHIVLPKEADVNIYHHQGKEHFAETGAVFINVVNRDYCKSYVIMLPGQKYPYHYHKIKTESFYILFGTLKVKINSVVHSLDAGEMIHIERGEDHMFWSDDGTVFEELSTNYTQNDSFYLEDAIQKTTYTQRRTLMTVKECRETFGEWIK